LGTEGISDGLSMVALWHIRAGGRSVACDLPALTGINPIRTTIAAARGCARTLAEADFSGWSISAVIQNGSSFSRVLVVFNRDFGTPGTAHRPREDRSWPSSSRLLLNL
jgi:hypothetical protein